MRFHASEFHRYYQLKPCGLRVYLHERGIPAAEPDAYKQLLERLGILYGRRQPAAPGGHWRRRGRFSVSRDWPRSPSTQLGGPSALTAGSASTAGRGRKRLTT